MDQSDFIVTDEMKARFLKRRVQDLRSLRAALSTENYSRFADLAHNLKGSSASYGFAELERIIALFEETAASSDAQFARQNVVLFEKWLNDSLSRANILQ